MPSLLELQRGFAAGILRPAGEDFMRHVRAGRFAPARHFQVYRNNVLESLTGALLAVYPVTGRLVGEGFFRYAAASYIPEHPPASGNLHDFGKDFAGYLAGFPPARELSYLPDVARLEWCLHESYHAAASRGLALDALARVPAEKHAKLRFRLQPSVRLLASDYPVRRIWQVNQADYAGNPRVDLDEGGAKLLVIRHQDVEIEPLADGEHALLAAFASGATFADAARAALGAQAGFDITAALTRHVRQGTLADFDVARE